ncbi:MAG: hypothetical protein U5K43_07980 [Halofilum sp. (in: g-proteobacteria)]|nr:hypothetical protein [Halofilum sp. (in: g-proteobacteria)]
MSGIHGARSALAVVLLVVPAAVAADTRWSLDGGAWARPRSGQAVLSMQPVASAVRAWSDAATAEIVIRYPGGEDGVLWASELRDWLVSLGVPSAHVRPVAGGEPGSLRLEVRPRGGGRA